MKNISEYEKPVVITILPNPMKHLATLRLEFSLEEINKIGYLDKFDKLCGKFRQLDFSVSIDKNLAFNYTDLPNVMEFTLSPNASEVRIAKDVEEELKKEFGDDSVLNRVMIKEKLKK